MTLTNSIAKLHHPWMGRLWRWGLRPVCALLACGLLLYLLWLLVNLRDQPASADALRLAQQSAPQREVLSAQNAYAFIQGFTAPRAQSPAALGQAVLRAQAQGATQAAPTWVVDAALAQLSKHDLNDLGLRRACTESVAPCEALLRTHADQVQALLARHAWVVARYQQLLALPYWQEPRHEPSTFNPPVFQHVLVAQKLYLLNLWQDAAQGRSAQLKPQLAQDIRFWRQALAESGSILSKMIAAAALRQHFLFGSVALAELPDAQAYSPPSWQTPFSPEELSMRRALTGDWWWLCAALRDNPAATTDEPPSIWHPLLRPMLQQQDSCNRLASAFEQQLALMEHAKPEELAGLRPQLTAITPQTSWLYNPYGSVLLSVNFPNMADYSLRVADLEGLRRAHWLALQPPQQAPGGPQRAR
jgi:hypothetical protein